MAIRRIAILPTQSTTSFSEITMPDGKNALVLNKRVHKKALEAADKKLQKALRSTKSGVVGVRTGKAA